MKLNERAWSGQIISWIKEAVNNGTTIFEDATNDEGIKVASGRTKFPDILLFSDKISGIVFNGWELKFPDTAVDDSEMLENALEKAERLNSDSFVTWNGAEAIIWKIVDGNYTLEELEKLKIYPKEVGIDSRNDLADRNNYNRHEAALKNRLNEILHDLGQLYQNGELKNAINISSNIVQAVTETAQHFIPQFKKEILELKGDNPAFRTAFNQWKIIESSTLKILGSSSRRVETVEPEEVLAKFTFYKLIGKILFYLTLSENLSGRVDNLIIEEQNNIKNQLNQYFAQAQSIDYQAIFESDFTDEIPFNDVINELLFKLVNVFNEFDFKILPTEVIGHILENLVPKEEKQKFGQYFTSETLANLVTFSAIRTRNDILIDPTSGTGTFLNAFYHAINFYGNQNHQQILNQIWGNDISHFPATLSVINLYKQKVDDTANFPRVIRKDYFTISPNQPIPIPDNVDIDKINEVPIPKFDAIISNFPFIQQEDIPKVKLNAYFEEEFKETQPAFINGNKFVINGKSDYYIYCFYNSLKFLKDNGIIAAITSNAWLGKNYGIQFKQFLLDNFHIKYVVRSNAEHWFKDSKVSTIFVVLEKEKSEESTRFVTINKKLEELFDNDSLQAFEDFYTDISYCDNPENSDWNGDNQFPSLFHKKDTATTVSIVDKKTLINSIDSKENWGIYFRGANLFEIFSNKLINPYDKDVYKSWRGTKTWKDDFHIISEQQQEILQIEPKFLVPAFKNNDEFNNRIISKHPPSHYMLVCNESMETLMKEYPKCYKYIKSYESKKNKKGVPLPISLSFRKPYWYSLKLSKRANIFISINPHKKLFFTVSKEKRYTNQRLTDIDVSNYNPILISALLNSVISLLWVELTGTSRNLGALDLNATFFKTKMKMLDPNLLSNEDKENILEKFEVLSQRNIMNYDEEYQQEDRVTFDEEILKAYGFNTDILPQLYELLTETIRNRVEMKNR